MEIRNKVLKTISDYNMIDEGDNILVGFSGGADSVALLLLLLDLKEKLGINEIVACHINHNLRETAKRDEIFCKEFCQRKGIEFFTESFDIKSLKTELKSSEEDVARIKRYETFFKLKKRFSITKIATAHNKNDVVENYLIRLFRGASLDGLTLIKPYREDGVIRPLLSVDKNEIYSYVEEQGEGFVVDETNFSDQYLRNSIRLNLIPVLKERYNPDINEVIYNTAKLNLEDSNYINENANCKFQELAIKSDKKVKFFIKDLLELPYSLLSRVIIKAYNALSGQKLLSANINAIMELIKNHETGKKLNLKSDIICFIDYDYFVIGYEVKTKEFSYPLNFGKNYIKELNKTFIISDDEGFGVPKEYLPYLALRNRRAGDKIFMKEIDGNKKIKDIFIDKKISREKRDTIPIITYKDEIISVFGIYNKKFNCQEKIYIKGV